MRILLMAGFGLALIALVLVLPMLHVVSWSGVGPTPLVAALAALPPMLLVVALFRPARFITLWLFPVSLLPALALEPRLVGPLVYSGTGGALALVAVSLVAAGWGIVSLVDDPISLFRRPPAALAPWLPTLAVLLPGSVLAAFALPALDAAHTIDAQVAVLSGLAIAGWSGYRWVVGELADLRFEPRVADHLVRELALEQRVNTGHVLGWVAAAAVVAGLVLLVFAN